MSPAIVLAAAAIASLLLAAVPDEALAQRAPETGRAPDGCVACHRHVTGLGESHRPDRIGCAACHGGDPAAHESARAHAGLIAIPGNLADAPRTCGQSGCHLSIAPRVERSIMSTMAGVVAANRRVLGEPVDESAPPHANSLGTSAADSHLRELCISCHLGQPKTEWGPIGQESRGGGCNACHLVYAREAIAQLSRYKATPPAKRTSVPDVHPALTLNPTNDHCFGCHSRSSRIATSYEGWHEVRGKRVDGRRNARLRKLDDGRFFERVLPDIHHERGLDCIDCHTSNELMGTGVAVARQSEQVRIGCEDCHAKRLDGVRVEDLDAESRALIRLRGIALEPSERVGVARNGEPHVNVVVDGDGRGHLLRKRTRQSLPLRAPAAACTQSRGHDRLSCASCHSAWAPRCTTCHTRFDPAGEGFDHLAQAWVKGTWNETAGPFEAAPPTLGIRAERTARGEAREVVDTFVPGMILTFDRNREAGKPADVVFRRLYARTFAHTVRREVRSCTSCHNDPVALGYGRGTLRFLATGNTGRWTFEPRERRSAHDGLPADAWIGFLQTRSGMVSTRDDVRPFTADEQRRILRVGACLTCHAGEQPVMQRALSDFDAALARRGARCAVPEAP